MSLRAARSELWNLTPRRGSPFRQATKHAGAGTASRYCRHLLEASVLLYGVSGHNPLCASLPPPPDLCVPARGNPSSALGVRAPFECSQHVWQKVFYSGKKEQNSNLWVSGGGGRTVVTRAKNPHCHGWAPRRAACGGVCAQPPCWGLLPNTSIPFPRAPIARLVTQKSFAHLPLAPVQILSSVPRVWQLGHRTE